MKRNPLSLLGLSLLLWSSATPGQVNQAWSIRYYSPFGGQSRAYAMTLDAVGNVYVTGGSVGETEVDLTTVKYDGNGNELWEARYAGLGTGLNIARAIAVDDAGNVYVTGESAGSNDHSDVATIKYDPNGHEQWAARYDGPGHHEDRATGIQVDRAGNVFVTGYAYRNDVTSDYLTIKYDPNGQQLWVDHYHGLGTVEDFAWGLALDDSGNAYVTGQSGAADGVPDYATIKYSPNGFRLWVARYDAAGGYDNANAIAVDYAGNVYVTGFSRLSDAAGDYATVKYDTDGHEQWVARYNGLLNGRDEAYAIKVDQAGNVYVTGESEEDYATVKYDPAGNELWEAHYDGATYEDFATALAVDSLGNVYVTGASDVGFFDYDYDYATIKYNADGNEVWVTTWSGGGCSGFDGGSLDDVPHAVAVDDAGNVYVAGETGHCFFFGGPATYATIKYTEGPVDTLPARIALQPRSQTVLEGDTLFFEAEGDGPPPLSYQWLFNQSPITDATTNTLALTAVTLSQAGGYQVVVSNPFGSATSIVARLTVQKAEGPGVERAWFLGCAAPERGFASVSQLTLDAAGNVYLIGTTNGSSGAPEYVTAKFDPDGRLLWVSNYDHADVSNYFARALAVDVAGNVYVVGSSIRADTRADFITLKYGPIGELLWVARYNGPDNLDDGATAVTLDNAGNVWVTGYSTQGGASATVRVQYDPQGTQLSVITFANPSPVSATDTMGNTYFARTESRASGDDYAVAKYDSSGQLLWTAYYNGPAPRSEDHPSAMTVDDAGNVYVTGSSLGGCCASPGSASGEGDDSLGYSTVKYGANGDLLWVARYTYPGNWVRQPTAIVVDRAGNVYVTGEGLYDGSQSFPTIKYDPDGRQLWCTCYGSLDGLSGQPRAITVDDTGNVYVTGDLQLPDTSVDAVTMKYDANGNRLWMARYNEAGSSAVIADHFGSVYVQVGCSSLKYQQTVPPGFPTILEPPQGVTAPTGADVTFNVKAAGAAPLHYHWRHNGNLIAGATNSTLRLTGLQVTDSGYYTVAVSNTAGTVVSPSARLSVALSLTITTQPKSLSTMAGAVAEFQVVVDGFPAYFQWRLNGTNLPDATQSTLHIAAVRGADAGNYTVVVTNAVSAVTSLVARLTVSVDTRQSWMAQYQAYHLDDEVVGLQIDNEGDVYMAGTTYGNTYNDFITFKYGAGGQLLWMKRYDGAGNTDDARALAVDAVGNVYVTGDSYGGDATGFDFATVKYDFAGEQTFVARYNGPVNGEDVALALAVDESGNVYVTGYSAGSGTGYDYATVKYDPNGTQLWVARYNGPGNGTDVADAIAVDSDGNVYVTGYSYGGTTTTNDYATIKYSADGARLWVARYNGPGNGVDIPYALGLDAQHNVYVTGRSFGSGTASDFATIKYASTNGSQLWLARYNGPGNGTDFAFDLKLDSAANVYVGGYSYGGASNSFDYAVVKYSPTGSQRWATRYNGPGSGFDVTVSFALDPAGNVYVTGSAYAGPETTNDFATVKLGTNGSPLWVAFYDGPSHGADYAEAVVVDNTGNVYVAGESHGDGDSQTFVVLKYAQNSRPTVSITNPPNLASFTFPATVPIGIQANDSDGSIARIELFSRTNKIGEITGPPFEFTWTNAAPGLSILLAHAVDDLGARATSASVRINVSPGQPPNTAPVFLAVPSQLAFVLSPLRVTNNVVDLDVPTNRMTFRLAEGPVGARLNTNSGVFSWTPSRAQAGSSNFVTIVVTDDGVPALSATNSFSVLVSEFVELNIGAAVLRAGESGTVPISVLSSVAITNLSFLLEAPESRLANLALQMLPLDIAGNLAPLGSNRSFINYNTSAGQPLAGLLDLGGLAFTTRSNQSSASVALNVANLTATQSDGALVPRTMVNPGRLVVVGSAAFLEALFRTNREPTLILYGTPQTSYRLESTTNWAEPRSWRADWQGTLTNLFQVFTPSNTNQTIFYRARE